MKFEILFLVPFICLVSCLGAKKESINQSVDFTTPGGFTSGIEGPATDRFGNLYVVNFEKEGTIGSVNPEGECELFVQLPGGSIGNGIRLDKKGNLYVADYTNHNVLKIDPGTKEIRVHAHNPEMNQPNDLAIKQSGVLYASDPNWKEQTGNLWRIDPDGSVHLLEENMGTTNGVEVSPDERKLYVNESVQRNVWVYDILENDSIGNKRLLIKFPDHGMDGMRCDSEGNLYITRYGKGTIAIVSPEGNLLNEVELKGKKPSNISFGGPDGKTCYITLQDRGMLEKFRAERAGRSWELWKD